MSDVTVSVRTFRLGILDDPHVMALVERAKKERALLSPAELRLVERCEAEVEREWIEGPSKKEDS